MYSLTGLKDFASAKDLVGDRIEQINKTGLVVLHNVSFSLSAVGLLFLIAFQINNSLSLSWFFLSITVAFALIPMLARKGFEKVSKFLLLAYVDLCILILSAVFGKDMLIQTFYVPACGLSILLFNKEHIKLRNLGIGMAVGCYLILDYVIFDQVVFSAGEGLVIKWSILAAAFVTTWMTFNKFSETKELAEEQTQELLKETQALNEELMQKKEELEENVRQLEKAKKKIEAGSKAKSEFLSTMSHEIRTPMNAIIGMTNLLVQDNPRENQMEQLEILDFSAKTLLSLINDVLDFSKIESGKIELEKVTFNLQNLLNGVMESFRFTADKKGVERFLEISEDIPQTIVGDPNRLTQILNNLLSNSVKFTDEGRVGIRVDVKQQQGGQIRLLFSVEDTGIGISKEKQKEIFNSFTQERAETSRLFGGTGLGLAISKRLVELQDGEIYVESEKGEGSTFYVELPFVIGDESSGDISSSKNENEKATPESLEGKTVLLVEDNIINQKVMMRFLERLNIKTLVAENGEKAVDMLQENDIQLVLMDLQMPVMDGYEATQCIRELGNRKKSDIPIVALTAAALKEVKEKVFAAGMNDYLTKPFNPSVLQNKLEYYILEKK